ncbi:MAG: hypothetical protein JNL60_03385 [Bacteroidia bacterium]|nr:hypothetical protein [Bacteroidia bacterium]
MSKVHIGKKIKEVWRKSRLKGTEFASLINRDRQVIYDIFKRESIDTELLKQISTVLNHDFFSYYSQQSFAQTKEIKPEYGYATKEELMQVTMAIQALTKQIEKLSENLPKKAAAKAKSPSNKKYGK